jgi:hypothetical protein
MAAAPREPVQRHRRVPADPLHDPRQVPPVLLLQRIPSHPTGDQERPAQGAQLRVRDTGIGATLDQVPGGPMASVNFTASVDRDRLRRAKVLAARNDTSVSALLNAELSYLVETCEQAESLGNGNAAVLLAFSLGRISDEQAMEYLRLEHEEDLFLLMIQAHLPMPRLSEEATAAMVAQLEALPRP